MFGFTPWKTLQLFQDFRADYHVSVVLKYFDLTPIYFIFDILRDTCESIPETELYHDCTLLTSQTYHTSDVLIYFNIHIIHFVFISYSQWRLWGQSRSRILPRTDHPTQQTLLVWLGPNRNHAHNPVTVKGAPAKTASITRFSNRPFFPGHRWSPFHRLSWDRLLPACHRQC